LSELCPSNRPEEFRELRRNPASLSHENRPHRFALPLIPPLINEKCRDNLRRSGPKVPFEAADHDKIETVETNVTILAVLYVPGEHTKAVTVSWGLAKVTGTGNFTLANVEPVPGKIPFLVRIHFFGQVSRD